VANANINQYSPSLADYTIIDGTIVHCQGTAVITWMLPGVPPVTLIAYSAAESRISSLSLQKCLEICLGVEWFS